MFDELLTAGNLIDGRFTLIRPLGRGGMGAVWLANDKEQGQDEIALKVLHPKFGQSKTAVERMTREAEALRRLDHPNISRPVAFSSSREITYLAMEYVDGIPLHEMIGARNGAALPLAAVARIFDELTRAVAYAHGKGIVHRDLKPQNVMIAAKDGELVVKVLDFGVAKFVEEARDDGTTQGRTIGSLFYLSPEQTRGDPAVPASDIFALGSMLFELLTSRRMWAKDKSGNQLSAFNVPLLSDGVNAIPEVVERICRTERARPTQYRAELARELDAVVARATAVDPADRHPTVDALRTDALAYLVPEFKPELTMVQPMRVDDEELLTTAKGRELLRLPSSLEPVHLPTRTIEGGVSSFLGGSGVTASTAEFASDTTPGPDPTASVGVVDPTQLMERRRSSVPAMPVTMGLTPTPTMTPSSQRLVRPVTNEISVRTQEARFPPALIGAAIVIAIFLVGTTYLITRATYERAAPPVASAAPVAPVPSPEPVVAAVAAPSPSPSPSSEPVEIPAPSAPAPRRPATKQKAAPSPTAAAPGRISQLLSRAREAPDDGARLIALSKAIASAAEKVPDPEARTSIRRVAASSAMVGDLSGLEDAYRELSRALDRAGEKLP